MRVRYHLPDDAADVITDYQNIPEVREILRTYRDLAGETIDTIVSGDEGESFAVGVEHVGLDPRHDPDALEAELNAVNEDGDELRGRFTIETALTP